MMCALSTVLKLSKAWQPILRVLQQSENMSKIDMPQEMASVDTHIGQDLTTPELSLPMPAKQKVDMPICASRF